MQLMTISFHVIDCEYSNYIESIEKTGKNVSLLGFNYSWIFIFYAITDAQEFIVELYC